MVKKYLVTFAARRGLGLEWLGDIGVSVDTSKLIDAQDIIDNIKGYIKKERKLDKETEIRLTGLFTI